MPEATPADVRVEYETSKGDPEIERYIRRAEREINRTISIEMDQKDRRDLEAALAAWFIASRSFDRAESSIGSGGSNVSYQSNAVESIEESIEALDPTGELPPTSSDTIHFESY